MNNNMNLNQDNYTANIDDPFVKHNDVEFEYENVYEDFLDDIKLKQEALDKVKKKYKNDNIIEEN